MQKDSLLEKFKEFETNTTKIFGGKMDTQKGGALMVGGSQNGGTSRIDMRYSDGTTKCDVLVSNNDDSGWLDRVSRVWAA